MTLSEYNSKVLTPTLANIPLPAPRKAGDGYNPNDEWADTYLLQKNDDDDTAPILGTNEPKVVKKKKAPAATGTQPAQKPKKERFQAEFKVELPRGGAGGGRGGGGAGRNFGGQRNYDQQPRSDQEFKSASTSTDQPSPAVTAAAPVTGVGASVGAGDAATADDFPTLSRP